MSARAGCPRQMTQLCELVEVGESDAAPLVPSLTFSSTASVSSSFTPTSNLVMSFSNLWPWNNTRRKNSFGVSSWSSNFFVASSILSSRSYNKKKINILFSDTIKYVQNTNTHRIPSFVSITRATRSDEISKISRFYKFFFQQILNESEKMTLRWHTITDDSIVCFQSIGGTRAPTINRYIFGSFLLMEDTYF